MKTWRLQQAEGETLSFTDRKRYLWPASAVYALLPFAGMGLTLKTGHESFLWLPLILVYLVVPVLDYVIGEDRSNPPESLVPQLEADTYYRWLTWLAVPVHFAVLAGGAWFLASHAQSMQAYVAITLSIGIAGGLAINTGHELGHKKTRLERVLARVVLAVPAYGHFTMEHTVGHHTDVATPQDSASARFGESIYAFSRREIPGGLRRGLVLERRRLRRLGLAFWHWRNEVLQSYALTVVFYAAMTVAFGAAVLPFLFLQALFAWWQLTSANYVEHYGLLRERAPGGGYVRCGPQHSWNANHVLSNVLLFHLERHSDHHAWPARRYQSLRHFDSAPQLPLGYFGMWLLAYLPWAWRKVMDPRLLRLVGGDLSKLNRCPPDDLLQANTS